MNAAHKDDAVYPNASKFQADKFLQKKKVPPVLTYGAPGSVIIVSEAVWQKCKLSR